MIKSLKNRKLDNERGLQGVFYIVDKSKSPSDQWWQIRLVESHYVVSAVGSYEHALECLKTLCKRYRTYKRLMRALRNCEHHISAEDKKNMDKEYASIGQVYSDIVEEIVSKCTNDIKEVTKKKPLFNRKRTIEENAPVVVEEEKTTPKPIVKRKPMTKLLKKK